MRPSFARTYALAQTLAIGGFFFVPAGWVATIWQVTVGWTGATLLFRAGRRLGSDDGVPFYLIGVGIFFNAAGILVEQLLRVFGLRATAPCLADFFYLSIIPGLIGGVATLVYRRSRDDSFGALLLSTLISTFLTTALGIITWEFVISPRHATDGLLREVVLTAYPVIDLVVLALVMRLLLGRARRSVPLGVMIASLLCFLAADIGWAVISYTEHDVGPALAHLLMMCSMSAYALMGGATLHPSHSEIVRPSSGQARGTSRSALVAIAVSALIAPAVLSIQAAVDYAYDAANR